MGWRHGFVAALAAWALGASVPAAADITVVGKYTFANGDTATRSSYYSRKRVRVTSPSGLEFIHDTQGRRVTVIDHAQRRYYQGTIEEADSVATRILLQRREEMRPLIEANREQWAQRMKGFNDSIRVIQTEDTKTIAGYPATRWMMLAGQYMTHERWVARGLSVPNFGPELEKAMMASVLDPLGRQLMKMLIQMREKDGTVLKSSTQFRTPTQAGSFSWEAIRVSSEQIPASVWSPPAGYTKATPGVR